MNKVKLNCILCFSFYICTAIAAYSATLSVPGTHSTIAAAISAASYGDIIEIASGDYSSGIAATISDDNLIIRGVGGRAHLNGDGVSISNGKAIFVTTGNNIRIENIEFSNVSVRDGNGAGIRHEGGLLTVNNCYFHDNENGILTSNQGPRGELVVENSEFNHNGLGRAGYTHNIYVGRIEKFVFRYSYSHHAVHGHNIKSRAQQNYILYSRIMDESSGNASYQIDLPNGGLSYIIGNSIHQGVNAENSRMISYAAEGAYNRIQQLYLSNNTMVNDRPNGKAVRLSGAPYSVLRNNIFDNMPSPVEGSSAIYENNLTTINSGLVDREGYDYHLLAGSPALDMGGDPGSYGGVSLTPTKEYHHPLGYVARAVDSRVDIGAFEHSSNLPPPAGPHIGSAPATYLLLR